MKNNMNNTNNIQATIENFIASGDFGFNPDIKSFLVDGMTNLLQSAFLKEREFHLSDNVDDKANGFNPVRNVNLGTTSIPISLPRTRSGDFYPNILPKYQRNIGGEYERILENIILNCKNFKSVSATVRNLGLGYSQKQIDLILDDLFIEAKKYNERQLDSDWLFLYADAKVIDMADESSSIKKAINFTVVGINMDGKKEMLLSTSFFGNENIDLWKKVIINLKNRGLTRTLMLITDDFSGLNKITNSLLPNSDHQLCIVHLMRNAKKNLDNETYEEFKQLISEIYLSGSFDDAYNKFNKFLDEKLKNKYSSYAKYLKTRAENYLAFTNYPNDIKPLIRSTNAVEGINNAIEITKRNSGGYFHSEKEINIKLKIIFDNLRNSKWQHPVPKIKGNLPALNQMFFERFEAEIDEMKFC